MLAFFGEREPRLVQYISLFVFYVYSVILTTLLISLQSFNAAWFISFYSPHSKPLHFQSSYFITRSGSISVFSLFKRGFKRRLLDVRSTAFPVTYF